MAHTIRRATAADIPAIVHMLADDELGATRESPDDLTRYYAAFEVIDADPHQHLVVAADGDTVTGTLQLTIVPGLSRTGMSRALIEAVRVHRDVRGAGLGGTLIEWAVSRARELNCGLVQLTSDITRTDAHRFYERLGFTRSHYGYKFPL
ncbi:N-acetylglutamate synthase-like GNAT family acetyltransferase [Stackebrandtia endophytica]|uniref:N-acetylglutamate synthase-like GNAT family acetyltransferase n=1 Tax=Stackebrandtia endophytica TaxID=1496996 RepID=A0A543B1E7_9ACTN|nr:GNAT family N-acetyltransferase [Stackebrandtia endophytica]TQL78606.1 N-acetylglutamate synthase-like GNAT family acetyltransferase [Stackebrandtia endophytica]